MFWLLLIVVLGPIVDGTTYCPSDSLWSDDFGGCVLDVELFFDWQTAHQLCLFQEGDLISVHNASQNLFLTRWVSAFKHTNTSKFYIGGVYGSEWTWTDGTNFNYSNFSPSSPQPGDNLTVIAIIADKTDPHWNNWTVVDTQEILAFACLLPVCTLNGRVFNGSLSGDGVLPSSDGTKYYFGNSVNRLQHQYANMECISLGGFLPTISNAFDNTDVMKKAQVILTDQVDSMFIGLANNGTDWFWADPHFNSSYTNWAPGEPSSSEANSVAIMNLKTGLWSSYSSLEYNHIICQALQHRILC